MLYLNKKIVRFTILFLATKGDSTIETLIDRNFYSLQEDKRWEKHINGTITKVQKKYGPYQDLEYAKILWRMLQKDQAYGYQLDLLRKQNKLYPKTAFSVLLFNMREILQNQNIHKLYNLVIEKGWPEKEEVGSAANSIAGIIVQHGDLEQHVYFWPYIKKSCLENNGACGVMALVLDRMRIMQEEDQYFGSQVAFSADGPVLEKLKYPGCVTCFRRHLKLEPLDSYLENFGIKYTSAEDKIDDRKCMKYLDELYNSFNK